MQVGAIVIARVRAVRASLFPYGTKGQEKMKKQEKPLSAEELAKKRGVALVQGPDDAPAPGVVPSGSWFGEHMPAVAQTLADMKAWLPEELWKEAAANLRAGRGYAVDLGTGLAIGSPPAAVWKRGKSAERQGFTVTRVEPVDYGTKGEAEARTFLGLLEFGGATGHDVPAALATIARWWPHLVQEFPDLAWPGQVLHPLP